MKFIYCEKGVSLAPCEFNIEKFVCHKDKATCFIKVLRGENINKLDDDGNLYLSADTFEKFLPKLVKFINELADHNLSIEQCVDRFFESWNNGDING